MGGVGRAAGLAPGLLAAEPVQQLALLALLAARLLLRGGVREPPSQCQPWHGLRSEHRGSTMAWPLLAARLLLKGERGKRERGREGKGGGAGRRRGGREGEGQKGVVRVERERRARERERA